jgi:hypothetical protein
MTLVMLMTGMATSASLFAQHGHSSPPPAPHFSAPPRAPAPRPLGGNRPSGPAIPRGGAPSHPLGEAHLGEWLQRNKGLSTEEQTRRLRQEPGFNHLTPEQQQNVTNRLRQLDQMPPQQRQRVLERVENMERLSPAQQQQVRGSARQLAQLPPGRQQAVKDAIRNLRDVPPGLRQSELNSPRYSGQLSPDERGIVGNLLSVEPYHPAPPPQR